MQKLTSVIAFISIVHFASGSGFAQSSNAAATADELGIAAVAPTTGPSVSVDGKFLVPYTTKIPGTDVKFQMAPIPGGVVTLGSPETEAGHKPDEGPQVQVAIAPMWFGRCEVTQGEFNQFMRMHRLFKAFVKQGIRKVTPENAARAVTAPTELYDVSDRGIVGMAPDLPAVGMTPFGAKQYTKWLSGLTGHQYRLPTEAEWEYACRAGSTTAFHFGDKPDDVDRYAWYEKNSSEKLHPIGSKLPNAFGLYDMHGNVREWTLDGYTAGGYASFANRPQPLQLLDAIQWPTRPDQRIARGGSWNDDPRQLRSAARFSSDDRAMKDDDPELPQSVWWYTSHPSLTIGFRIVRSYHPFDEATIRRCYEPDHPDIADALHEMLDYHRAVRGIVDPSLAEELTKQTLP